MMGEVGASAGIAEEDGDEGVEAIANRFAAKAAAHPLKRRRVSAGSPVAEPPEEPDVPLVDAPEAEPPEEPDVPLVEHLAEAEAALEPEPVAAAVERLPAKRSQVGDAYEDVPDGCSCRRYLGKARDEAIGYWEAKLPPGLEVKGTSLSMYHQKQIA